MTNSIDIEQLQHSYIYVNGIRMHYVTAGRGPLCLLLHGFPEFWYSWRHQIAALRPYFTVVAPDLRGYNETDKPTWGYEVDVLVADVVELIHALGYQRAVIAGHDWGGMLAWFTALRYPQRVERLISLNIPHPALMVKALHNSLGQILRSSYIALFQLPWLPEAFISANNYAALEYILRGTAIQKNAFNDQDIQAFKTALSKPGAVTAALNWYRRLRQSQPLLDTMDMTVKMPTLLIWGQEDAFLGAELTHGTERYVSDLHIHYIAKCAHWVQQEKPTLVNRCMLDFLADMIMQQEEAVIG